MPTSNDYPGSERSPTGGGGGSLTAAGSTPSGFSRASAGHGAPAGTTGGQGAGPALGPEAFDEDGPCVSPLLAAAARTSVDTEFYSPIPDGYRFGKHKYLVVLGTVISGLGKGIFASSLAKLLKDKGLSVAPMKMEGYLNIDAGTLNPFRHGEVFVLDDGTECDMDLGTYERMLDQNLSKRNFVTSGQIFRDILDRERHGGYLGRDVQMIPHVTGDVKRRLRELAMHGDGSRPADIVFVEVGGTVGDYENGFYIEALRELAFEEGPNSVCFVALTYIVEPGSLGEQKSKAAQLGIKRVMEAGIQPHIIACRSANPCTSTVLQKIAMFTNVAQKRVFSMHDRKSVYEIPDAMRSEGLDREVLSILGLHDRVDLAQEDRHRERWMTYVRKMATPPAGRPRKVTIGITGKYAGLRDAYASIDKAVEHCSTHLACDVDLDWISATDVTDDNAHALLGHLDAVIVPGGFGARGVEGKISCVRYCREAKVPYLGICLGFQVAVIEFARNVMGLRDANSTEFDPHCPQPVISELPDQKRIEKLGGSMRLGGQMVQITSGTLAYELYRNRESIRERFRHRYEVDPGYVERLEAAGLIFSGRHPVYPIMQVLELPRTVEEARGVVAEAGEPARKPPTTHPFFVAGQFHPELTGRPLRPQPMFMGLVAAAIKRRYPEQDPFRQVREAASVEVA
ncbi:MAG: CTP synthase [Phycisphaerales bacterium]